MLTEKPAVVLLGMDSYVALQTARIFQSLGVPVSGIAADTRSPMCRTNALDRLHHGVPEPAFCERLQSFGQEFEAPPVLIPCSDVWVRFLSGQREQLEPFFRFALPDHETLEMLINKSSLYSFAEVHGLPIARFRRIVNRADAIAASSELSFPLIVKPALRSDKWIDCAGRKAVLLDTHEELMRLFDRCSDGPHGEIVAQEWIPGDDGNLFSCNVHYGEDGSPLATFVARKIRQYPPMVGESSLGQEVKNDEVLALTLRLFDLVGFRGLGYVEVKRHEVSGQHYLIEPNVGRPTGRSSIAEAGGVPILQTMYCDLVGLPLPADREQKYVGAKWIYLTRDTVSALYYIWKRKLTLREWWSSVRGPKVYAVFAWKDPVPFVLDIWEYVPRPKRAQRDRA